jgi:hypothetical protein
VVSTRFWRSETCLGAWVQGTNLSDELNHQRVVNAIDSQLARKGFGKVDSNGGPDVLVAYHIAYPEKREKSINKAAEKIFKNYPRGS